MTTNAYTAIDLFCGCGGMTTGLVSSGINVIAGVDIWDTAIESYRSNHPSHLSLCADLRTLEPTAFNELLQNSVPIDIITGSPPCQGMSIAGKRDPNDPRNSLFMEFVKFINHFNPKVIVMENVMGMLTMKSNDNLKVIDIVMSHFDNYNCIVTKPYACDYEVPQLRRRVIIIGVRKDLNIIPTEVPIVKDTFGVNVSIPVSTVLEPRCSISNNHFLSAKAIDGIELKRQRSLNSGKGFGAQFLKMDRPSYTIPARYWKDGYDALVKYTDVINGTETVTVRRLTVLELKRIQTFPDNYTLCGSKRDKIVQIGNAVACRFAHHLGVHIQTMLSQRTLK